MSTPGNRRVEPVGVERLCLNQCVFSSSSRWWQVAQKIKYMDVSLRSVNERSLMSSTTQ
jgi:hypothetical protein